MWHAARLWGFRPCLHEADDWSVFIGYVRVSQPASQNVCQCFLFSDLEAPRVELDRQLTPVIQLAWM